MKFLTQFLVCPLHSLCPRESLRKQGIGGFASGEGLVDYRDCCWGARVACLEEVCHWQISTAEVCGGEAPMVFSLVPTAERLGCPARGWSLISWSVLCNRIHIPESH